MTSKKHASSKASRKRTGKKVRKARPKSAAQLKKEARKRPNKSVIDKALAVLLLVASVVLIVAARIHYLEIPFDRDEGAYGYLGWMALTGATPYVDFYEMKPPLLFYSYALLIAIFGKTTTGLHLAAMLLNLVSTFFVFKLGKHIWDWTGGIFAAIGYLFLSFNIYASGFALQSEVVVLAYAVPGLYLVWIGAERRTLKTVFWGAVLLSCSALVKQNSLMFCLAGMVIMVSHAFPLPSWNRKELIRWIAAFVVGGLTPVILMILLLALTGSLDDFWYWIYEHPTKYVAARTFAESTDELSYFWQTISSNQTFWIISVVAGIVALPFVPEMSIKNKAAVAALFVLSALSIVPGMRFYGHYWLLFFLGWAMVIPGLFVIIKRLLAKRTHLAGLLATIIFAAGMVWQVVVQWQVYYTADLGNVLESVYKENFFKEHKILSDWLEPQLREDDQLIVMGSEPQIYLYTDKKAPTRHFYMTFTSKVIPEAKQWEREVMNDIETSSPEYVVFNYEPFSWMFKPDSRRELYNWMYRKTQNDYTAIAVYELGSRGTSQLITGPQVANYQPRQSRYIVVSKRNNAQ